MKDSIVFYRSFFEAIKNIPKEEQLDLYNAIFEYSFMDKEPKLEEGIAKAMFILMKPNIDSANARYKASVENGKRGGRPKKDTEKKPNQNLDKTQPKPNQNLDKTQTKPSQNLNVNYNVDYNIDYNIKEKIKRKVFVAPSLEDIQNYIQEKNLSVDGKQFYDFFTEGNWIDSKGNKVKNWKQKLLTWNKYADKTKAKYQNYEQRKYEDLSSLYANK